MLPAGKRPDLIVHEAEPFNAETPAALLAASSRTPVDAFYVRGHGAIPQLDPDDWRLRVGGLVRRELELDLAELRGGRFEVRDVVATLQCAGNRRAGLVAVRDIPGEAPWGPGATGTACWRGVALADVLASAGVTDAATHVAFVGADHCDGAEPPQAYGASIALHKALGAEVLLAWEMNGAPLPAAHGAPLRVIVPGFIGARSVKWLERIEVRHAPWRGWFQDTAYRLLAPEQHPGAGVGMALGEVALNADILVPADGKQLSPGRTEVRGYAFAGGDRRVARVDVSLDAGSTWRQAALDEDLGRWAWRLWRIDLELALGEHELCVRAWDSASATQPEQAAHVWNPKGYVNNAWGRARLNVT